MFVKHDARALLLHQLESLYGASSSNEIKAINSIYLDVLRKIERCFAFVNNKYYQCSGEVHFNPLHIAQWTMFCYMMANTLSRNNADVDLCDKIYGISKCFSSADIFYGVEMPEVWFFDHPQGSVMGRAHYGNFFTFSQGCTVGNNKGVYPTFGNHVSMMSGSKILGSCNVGHHVIFSANSYIIDTDVPPYSIVFGEGKNVTIHPISHSKFHELTKSMFNADDDCEENNL